jgi:tripartite-type tricarboxylate transporter receptor subunit TctC
MNHVSNILFWAAVAGTVVLGTAAFSHAESYPTRHVRIITAGAGTFHDIVARKLAQRLGERWGQAVIVENQPAAGMTIGTAMAAKAEPDGYTLVLADRSSLAAAPNLYKDLRYDPIKDLRPITLVARAPSLVVMDPSVPATNLREFLAYARRQAAPVVFASAGYGTVTHLSGELFAQLAGIKILSVQYKGGSAAAMAVLSGEAKFSIISIPIVLPQIVSGRVKALAIASHHRFAGAPDIPTSAEAGLPGFESEQWVGMLAPAATPNAIVDKLNHDIRELVRTPQFEEILRLQGGEVSAGTSAEFASFIASETARLKKLMETTGVRIE